MCGRRDRGGRRGEVSLLGWGTVVWERQRGQEGERSVGTGGDDVDGLRGRR